MSQNFRNHAWALAVFSGLVACGKAPGWTAEPLETAGVRIELQSFEGLGGRLRVRARVHNLHAPALSIRRDMLLVQSGDRRFVPESELGAVSLPDGGAYVLSPGETLDLDVSYATSGYAWKDQPPPELRWDAVLLAEGQRLGLPAMSLAPSPRP